MKCPHCLVMFHADWRNTYLAEDGDGPWGVRLATCPNCKKVVIQFGTSNRLPHPHTALIGEPIIFVRPHAYSRSPLSPDVPPEFIDDYKEACDVITASEKASAALSRRSLQHLLREKAGTKKRDLADQIQEVLDSKQLPSHLADNLDAVRAVGNFGAHPMKSTNTGEIVDVEPGEAEWLLEVLEGLFDFYFVEPAKSQKRRDALNQKLQQFGKPPLKTS